MPGMSEGESGMLLWNSVNPDAPITLEELGCQHEPKERNKRLFEHELLKICEGHPAKIIKYAKLHSKENTMTKLTARARADKEREDEEARQAAAALEAKAVRSQSTVMYIVMKESEGPCANGHARKHKLTHTHTRALTLADRQTDKQTDRQMHKQTDRRIHTLTHT